MVSVEHQSLLALVWTSFSVALLFVTLRTAIRLRITSRPTADDYWITLALVALLALCVLETIQHPSLYHITGILDGKPISDINQLIVDTETYLKYEFTIIILFWTVLWCVKASFLALYCQFFHELKLYRRAWYMLVVFSFLAYIGCITTLALSCGSPANFFRFAQCAKPEQIWASNLSVYYSTSVDVFTDLCIMAMPLRLIYNVKQISRKQKLGLVCVFSLCFVMIAFSIVRAKQVLVPQHFVDLTLLMIWSTLSASIAVVVGSMPAFKVFLTNRATAKRSRIESNHSKGVQLLDDDMRKFHGKDVPMRPLSDDSGPSDSWNPSTSNSQERISQPDPTQYGSAKHRIQGIAM